MAIMGNTTYNPSHRFLHRPNRPRNRYIRRSIHIHSVAGCNSSPKQCSPRRHLHLQHVPLGLLHYALFVDTRDNERSLFVSLSEANFGGYL